MLELRPNCECCDADLPPAAANARICSYECTFCADCVDHVLHNVCPNCGGGFAPRPIRPVGEWRPGEGLIHHPAGSNRRHLRYTSEAVSALSDRLRVVAPSDR